MSDPKIPTSYDELFPGRFLKAHECLNKPTFTIEHVRIETLSSEDKGDKDTPLVMFRESPRGLVLNKTNGQCLKHMFGPVLDEWKGRRIVLMCDDNVQLGRERVSGVRIYGSPDIAKDTAVEIKLPKRKARMHKLVCTAKSAPKPPKPDPVDAAEDARVSRLQSAAVTAVQQTLGGKVVSTAPDASDMKATVTRLRAEMAALMRHEDETEASAVARATEALGSVSARNYAEWMREAESAIAAQRAGREPGADG